MLLLNAQQNELESLGVQSLALFGSVVRAEAHSESDVDLLVQFQKPSTVSLMKFVEVQQTLERILGVPVDLIQPENLKPNLKERILAEAVIVFPATKPSSGPPLCERMPSKDWRERVQDMVDAIDKIERYCQGQTYESFQLDELRVDAVIRNITILGECASTEAIPMELQNRHPEVPWGTIKGFRNLIVHRYDIVDLGIVWRAVQEEFPQIKAQLQSIILQDTNPEQLEQDQYREEQRLANRRIYRQYADKTQRKIDIDIAQALLQENYNPEEIAAILAQSPRIQQLKGDRDRTKQYLLDVIQEAEAMRRKRSQNGPDLSGQARSQ